MRLSHLIIFNALAVLALFASEPASALQQSAVRDLVKAVELEHQGHNAEAKPILLDVVRRLEEKPGEASIPLGVALNDLGAISHSEGRYDEAETRYRHAIRVLDSQQDSTSQAAQAYAKFNLGRLYLETGRSLMAERLGLPAALESLPDLETRITAEATLAGMAAMQKDYPKAEEIYLRILSYRRDPARVALSQVQIASLLNNLAVIATWRGKREQARNRVAEVVAIWSATDLDTDPAAARVMSITGIVCTQLKQYDDALRLLSRSTRLVRERYGESHPLTAAVELTYAEALNKAGKKPEAKEMARLAGEARKEQVHSFLNATIDYRDLMSAAIKTGR